MRHLLLSALALVISGCAREAPRTDAAAGCTHSATHNVQWSSEQAADAVSVRADGPTCAEAVVLFVLRRADGALLWTFATPYSDMRPGGRMDPVAADGDEVEAFLASWADVSINRSGALPPWNEGAAAPGDANGALNYSTAHDRETYEALRLRDLPQLCLAVAAEATQCLVMDPVSQAPTAIVAFGP